MAGLAVRDLELECITHVRSGYVLQDVRRLYAITFGPVGVSYVLIAGEPRAPKRSIMELEGLGSDIWAGIDPKPYVSELRDEWNHR